MRPESYARLIDNDIAIASGRFAAIIGGSPSRGARSPGLWNAAFAAAGLEAAMHPMDVAGEGLAALVAALRADTRFIGGAVTVPHKQAVSGLLDRVEAAAGRIGAVNAVYRDGVGRDGAGRDGAALVGANTDGAAALAQIEALVGGAAALAARRALVIGIGGGGLAVAAYLAGRTARLNLANRTRATAERAAARLGAGVVDFPVPATVLGETDLLVNATTLGFQDGPAGAPDTPVSAADLKHLPERCAVYDIVYQPSQTPLLAAAAARGLSTRNGLGMNLDQAAIAFLHAVPDSLDLERVRDAMRAA